MNSSSTPMDHYITKPALVGAAGAAISAVLYDRRSTITVKGTEVNLSLALGVGMAVGSALAEVVHQNVFPMIGPTDRATSNIAATAVTVGTNVASTSLLLSMNKPDDLATLGLPTLLVVATGAELIGDYIYSNFWNPKP